MITVKVRFLIPPVIVKAKIMIISEKTAVNRLNFSKQTS